MSIKLLGQLDAVIGQHLTNDEVEVSNTNDKGHQDPDEKTGSNVCLAG